MCTQVRWVASHIAALRAVEWLLVRVRSLMGDQIARARGCIVTLVAPERLFASVLSFVLDEIA